MFLAALELPRTILRQGLKNQFGSHHDRLVEAAVNRAIVGKNAVNPAGRLAVLLNGLELQLDVNAPDDENMPFQLDFADSFGVQPVV
jgi:hypothetical protein